MPEWIHERARHLLDKNPKMPEGEAFAIATQQSHALGKSPKGYGTVTGRLEAKAKYTTPGDDQKTAQDYEINDLIRKSIERGRRHTPGGGGGGIPRGPDGGGGWDGDEGSGLSAIPLMIGLLGGYSAGRNIAGETAAAIAPKGRVTRSENVARQVAIAGAPAGAIGGMATVRALDVGNRLADALNRAHPGGLVAHPEVERAVVQAVIPMVAGIAGAMAGGLASGAAVGGVQRLRGSPFKSEAKTAMPVATVESYAKKKLLKDPGAAKGLAERGMRLMERGTNLQVANRPERGMWMAHPAGSALTQSGFALHQAAQGALSKTAMTAFGEELESIIKESFQTSMYSGPLSYGPFKQQSSLPPFRVPPLAVKQAAMPGITPPPPMPTGTGPAGMLAKAKHIGTTPNRTVTGPSINQVSKPNGFGVKLPGAGKGNTTI